MRHHLWVSGRVQNVWFRDGCATEARARGADGWVRNLADGRVEVVLEGEAAVVAAVEAWCAVGTSRSRVDRVEVLDEPPLGDGLVDGAGERGFAVR